MLPNGPTCRPGCGTCCRLTPGGRWEIDLDRVVDSRLIRRAAVQAVAATLALVLGLALIAPALSRATGVATAYLFPARLQLEVQPGSANVRAGDPLTIAARLAGVSNGSVVPTVSVQVGDETRALRMEPTDDGRFAVTIERVTVPFEYRVTAASARSDQYAVQVVRPPHVERIDLHYQFPKGLGLEPRTDEDSGDIYGPAGTDVRLSVTADKPIASAALVLEDGSRVALNVNGTVLTAG